MVTAISQKTKTHPFQFQLWKVELKEAMLSLTMIQIPSTQILKLYHISEIQKGSKFYETLLIQHLEEPKRHRKHLLII